MFLPLPCWSHYNCRYFVTMASANVSSSVLSIIASFSSGLDVFKKLRERRKRRRGRSKTEGQVDNNEQLLSRSLRQGPEDIGREYQRCSHSVVGEHMAVGDRTWISQALAVRMRLTWSYSLCADLSGRDPAEAEYWSCEHYHILLGSREARSSGSGL
jgi:hypothetical protein